MGYRAEFGRSTSKDVSANRGNLKIGERLDSSLYDRAVLDPLKKQVPSA